MEGVELTSLRHHQSGEVERVQDILIMYAVAGALLDSKSAKWSVNIILLQFLPVLWGPALTAHVAHGGICVHKERWSVQTGVGGLKMCIYLHLWDKECTTICCPDCEQLATYLMQHTERVSTEPAASSEMRQLGLRPPRGETFERRLRLTSNPPAVGSCDALASWDVRSQSTVAPAPAAASGYSWSQNKTVQQLKSAMCKILDAWAFLNTSSLDRLQRAQLGSVR